MSVGTIISVEDSDTDFLALRYALHAAGVENPIERYDNGRTAAGGLLSDRNGALVEMASLILLDLNLPGLDGRDLLRKVRARDPERKVPIIVLSTSSHPKDIDACYRAGADAYMVKPLELEDWESKVGQLAQSWLRPASRAAVLTGAGLDSLTRIIEGEIIPRLLLAHSRPADASSSDFVAGEEEVAELTRLLLTQDVGVASAYLETIRGQGATLGSLYLTLLAPAAQLMGDWWRDDRYDFTEVSLALSRLQHLLRDSTPPHGGQVTH
jgi:CheY-like chemotaxis protein